MNKEQELRIGFFGHSKIWKDESSIMNKIIIETEKFIQNGAKCCLVGVHGDFDKLVLRACLELKSRYNELKVVAVMTSFSYLDRKDESMSLGDFYKSQGIETMIFDIENVFYKQRITYTNRKIVDMCDIIVCYIEENRIGVSGAKKAVNYAKRKNKVVVNLA